MKQIRDDGLIRSYMSTSELGQIFGDDVARASKLFQVEKGEQICQYGQVMHYLFFLVKGEAKIFTTLDNGKNYLLRIESPLSVYGDLEILQKDTYSAYVEALGPCEVLGVPVNLIRTKYLNQPEFLQYIVRSLASRLDKISHMSTANLLLPLKNKFASYLLAHMEKTTGTIALKSSFAEVAEQLGTTYRHLSRTMNEMVMEGLIDKQGKVMAILKLDQVTKIAGDTYRY